MQNQPPSNRAADLDYANSTFGDSEITLDYANIVLLRLVTNIGTKVWHQVQIIARQHIVAHIAAKLSNMSVSLSQSLACCSECV